MVEDLEIKEPLVQEALTPLLQLLTNIVGQDDRIVGHHCADRQDDQRYIEPPNDFCPPLIGPLNQKMGMNGDSGEVFIGRLVAFSAGSDDVRRIDGRSRIGGFEDFMGTMATGTVCSKGLAAFQRQPMVGVIV